MRNAIFSLLMLVLLAAQASAADVHTMTNSDMQRYGGDSSSSGGGAPNYAPPAQAEPQPAEKQDASKPAISPEALAAQEKGDAEYVCKQAISKAVSNANIEAMDVASTTAMDSGDEKGRSRYSFAVKYRRGESVFTASCTAIPVGKVNDWKVSLDYKHH